MEGEQSIVLCSFSTQVDCISSHNSTTNPANIRAILSNLTEHQKFNFYLLLSFLRIRWWVCWTRAVCHISPKATTPSHLWRAASSPLLACPPAAASVWITSRAWKVWPVFPPCRLCPPCPALSPTVPPPTAHQATLLTMWHPTSTASTDKVRSIDFTFLFSLFASTPRGLHEQIQLQYAMYFWEQGCLRA